MNENAPLESQNSAVEGIAPTVTKLTVKQLLSRFRNTSLVGVKKFRKRGTIAIMRNALDQLVAERDFFKNMILKSALLQSESNRIIAALINESNFALDEEKDVILWVGDDKPLEEAHRFLRQFSEAMQQPQHQSSPPSLPTHIENSASLPAPTVQDGQL